MSSGPFGRPLQAARVLSSALTKCTALCNSLLSLEANLSNCLLPRSLFQRTLSKACTSYLSQELKGCFAMTNDTPIPSQKGALLWGG